MPPPVASSRAKFTIPRFTSELGLDAPEKESGSSGLNAESYTFELSSYIECWSLLPFPHINKKGNVIQISCLGLPHDSIADVRDPPEVQADHRAQPVETTLDEAKIVSGDVRRLVDDFFKTKTEGNPRRL